MERPGWRSSEPGGEVIVANAMEQHQRSPFARQRPKHFELAKATATGRRNQS